MAALAGAATAQSFPEAKAKFDAGDFAGAAALFESVAATGGAAKAEAAAFVLRSWSKAGRHDKVLAQYDTCLAGARGTEFEAECAFERAKSTDLNAKDTTLALQQYAEILAKYPNNVFAASGALLQRGNIELNSLKTPEVALDTFEEALTRYPTSPFADDALLAEAQAGVRLARLDMIDSVRRRLEAMGANPAMLQKVQFERAEYFNRASRDRYKATEEYRKVYTQFAADTNAAGMAKIRAADLVPGGDFRAALALYQDVLANHPRLPKKLRDWSACQSAIYLYQLEDEAAARAAFEALLATNPEPKLRTEAQRYLAGMANPESTDSLTIHYDRGIRFRQTEMRTDKTFWEMERVISKSRKPFFRSHVDDTSIDREERAQMLYRLCFAYFWTARGKEAFDLAGEILDRLQPQGVTRWECLHMRAHLLARLGDHAAAVGIWRDVIDADPPIKFLPRCYLEYAHALHLSGDPLGAILALEEMSIRWPARIETESAATLLKLHYMRRPDLRPRADEQRPVIAAKWKHKPPLIADGADDAAPAVASPTNSTGGAQ